MLRMETPFFSTRLGYAHVVAGQASTGFAGKGIPTARFNREEKKATFRVVTATHRNLEEEVVQGGFRQDLFYRLDVVRITIPPLRDRPGDIPALANHFLELYRNPMATERVEFMPEAIELLQRHEWPGNVRELENVIHSILVLKDGGPIRPEEVAAKIHGRILSAKPRPVGAIDLPEEGIDLKEALERMEQSDSPGAGATEGNKAAAAALLGLESNHTRRKAETQSGLHGRITCQEIDAPGSRGSQGIDSFGDRAWRKTHWKESVRQGYTGLQA